MPVSTQNQRPTVPAYQELADRLREQILSGEFKPGDRLPVEPELCALYGVSRSTVREALRVLSSQNLVMTTRGVSGGSFVVHPDPAHISDYLHASIGMLAASERASVDDLLEVRELLEVPAAGLAALRRSQDDLVELRSTLIDLASRRTEEIFPATSSFHVVLLRIAANPLLEAVTRPVFGVLNERFLRERAPARFWKQVNDDHSEIIDMVERGDAEGARAAQHDHLERLRGTYRRIDRSRRRS